MPEERRVQQFKFDLTPQQKEQGAIAYTEEEGPCTYCGEPTKLIFPPLTPQGWFVLWVRGCVQCRGQK